MMYPLELIGYRIWLSDYRLINITICDKYIQQIQGDDILASWQVITCQKLSLLESTHINSTGS